MTRDEPKITKIHSILGVEIDQQFKIVGLSGTYSVSSNGWVWCDKDWISTSLLCDLLNGKRLIIIQPLTAEQRDYLTQLVKLFGARWLTKDYIHNDTPYFEVFMDGDPPVKSKGFWFGDSWFHVDSYAPCRMALEPLVSFDKPFDILAALKTE